MRTLVPFGSPGQTLSIARCSFFVVAVAQFLLVALMVVSNARADAISVVDQQNPGPFNGSAGGVVFGQSFTPTLSRIDFFEVEIGDFGAIDEVQILNGVSGFDGLSGAVLGTSDPAATEAASRQPVQFIFPGGIALTPGNTYVARIFSTNGDFAPGIAGISITTDNAYTGGQLLEAGFSDTDPFLVNYDAVFREGLTSVPEVPTLWSVAVGLGITVLGARRLISRGRFPGPPAGARRSTLVITNDAAWTGPTVF
jgi:hypothetical protein